MPEKNYSYPAVFSYADGSEIAVTFPDLNVATCGKDDAEALKMARELLGMTVSGLIEDGESIPSPSDPADIVCRTNEKAVLIETLIP